MQRFHLDSPKSPPSAPEPCGPGLFCAPERTKKHLIRNFQRDAGVGDVFVDIFQLSAYNPIKSSSFVQPILANR